MKQHLKLGLFDTVFLQMKVIVKYCFVNKVTTLVNAEGSNTDKVMYLYAQLYTYELKQINIFSRSLCHSN